MNHVLDEKGFSKLVWKITSLFPNELCELQVGVRFLIAKTQHKDDNKFSFSKPTTSRHGKTSQNFLTRPI